MSARVPSLVLAAVLFLVVMPAAAQQPAPAPQPQTPNNQQVAPAQGPACPPAATPAPEPAAAANLAPAAQPAPAPAPATPPEPQAPAADKKLRVYIDYTESWSVPTDRPSRYDERDRETTGRRHENDKDSPEMADILKSFRERCPEFIVTQAQDKAAYLIDVTKSMPAGATSTASGLNKVVLTNHDGDILFSNSTRLMKNAIKDVCYALKKELGMPIPEKK